MPWAREAAVTGTFPEVSLAKARARREDPRRLIADNAGPSVAKQAEKNVGADTFRVIATEWLSKQRLGVPRWTTLGCLSRCCFPSWVIDSSTGLLRSISLESYVRLRVGALLRLLIVLSSAPGVSVRNCDGPCHARSRG